MSEPRRRPFNVFHVAPVVKIEGEEENNDEASKEKIRIRSKSLILHNRPPGLMRSSFIQKEEKKKRYWFQRRGSYGHAQLEEEEGR